jgi:hypothetical protein
MIRYTILMHLKKKTEIFPQNSNYGQSTEAGGWSGSDVDFVNLCRFDATTLPRPPAAGIERCGHTCYILSNYTNSIAGESALRQMATEKGHLVQNNRPSVWGLNSGRLSSTQPSYRQRHPLRMTKVYSDYEWIYASNLEKLGLEPRALIFAFFPLALLSALFLSLSRSLSHVCGRLGMKTEMMLM